MKDSTAARKYAIALFREAKNENQVLACQQGLQEIVRVAKSERTLVGVLSHPFIASEEKRRTMGCAIGEYSTPLLERFYTMLIQKRRFALLFGIARYFQEEMDRDQNVEAVRVRSALPMSDLQKNQLKTELEKWLGAQVRMDVQIDPSLIGGVVIQSRDRVLDDSLSGQLQDLRQHLSS